MFSSPLEQFEIIKIISLSFKGIDFSFTNSSFWSLVGIFSASMILYIIIKKATLIPYGWQHTVEILYEFVFFNILTENIKKSGNYYFPFIFTLFLFIFCSNILGMIPYCFTITSHIAITLSLALTAFVGVNLIGIKKHGFHMLSLFLPSGAPISLAPLLVIIEFVSYIFRVISLALRLFANMMSGHCLLKILAGFAWTMLSAGGVLSLLHFVPLFVIFAIIGLELAIAFLQAYVFTVLLSIYLNDAISLH